jgi:hypothetical protein
MGHDAEILGVYDPDLGYYAEKCPYKQPQRAIRPTFLAGLLPKFRPKIGGITTLENDPKVAYDQEL